MTREEMQKYVLNFFNWSSRDTRPMSSWMLSLETWAKMEYETAYNKEESIKLKECYQDGYMCEDGAINPYPSTSLKNTEWQRGYDDSVRINAPSLPDDHPDVIRLGCGYNDIFSV